MYERIRVEIVNRYQIIYLNNESNLNLLSTKVLSEIASALEKVEEDDQIDSCIIYGGRKAFSAGSDISEMQSKQSIDVFFDTRTRSWNQIFNFKKPLISAINRLALGSGFELALMSDVLIADREAVFGSPEIDLGLIPGASATVLLPKLIGKARAFDWMVTGKHISAEELERLGVVTKTVDCGETLIEAKKFAELLSSKSLLSSIFIKESLRFANNFDEARKAERMLFSLIFSSANAREGIEAYLQKRKANFKN